MDAARPNLDVLLAEASWVRALAHSLVRDPAAADDVVQETWLAALRRPPDTTRPVRPWLARVVENFARMRMRGEAGRERREERVARPESLASTEDLCARVETQRLLAQEVLALDEPFRSTIVLRYYEGLSAAEIARRVGAPSATVRWRLMRGLEYLRERLDARHDGDREAWSALLLPLAAGAASKTALKSAAGFGLLVARAVMLLMLLLGLAWVWRSAARHEDAVAVAVEPNARVMEAPKQVPNEAVSGVAARAAIPSTGEPGTGARASGARVVARIVDDELRPLAGAQFVVPSLAVSATAGGDGAVELLVPRERRELLAFEARAAGCVVARVEARLARDGDTYLGDVVAARAGALAGFVGDDLGRPIQGARVRAEIIGSRWRGVSRPPLEEARYIESLHADAPLALTGADGRYRFDALPRSFVRLWASADGYRTDWSADVSVVVGETVHAASFVLAQPPPEQRLAGVVLGPDGAPVPQAELECARPSLQNTFFLGERGVIRARADEYGRFDFGVDPQSHYDLAARAADASLAPGIVEALAPGQRDIVVRLTHARRIAISARDENGAPVSYLRIEFRAAASGKSLQREGKRFRESVSAMPHVAFGVRVSAPNRPALELGPFDPQTAPEQIDVVLPRASQFTGSVTSRAGAALAGARVQLLAVPQSKRGRIAPDSVVSGEAFALLYDALAPGVETMTDVEGRFALDVPQSGSYMARADAFGFAAELIGPFELGERGAVDGDIELGTGGVLQGVARRRDGGEVVGTVIGVSCGDGWLATTRVGADGVFRFEDLAERAWQVRCVPRETVSDGFEPLESAKRAVASSPPTWEVELRDGAIARCEVFVDESVCVLRGRLLFDGAAAGVWQVELKPARDAKRAPVVGNLDPDGRFELRTPSAGEYELKLARVSRSEPALELTSRVRLADGVNDWSRDFATAKMRVSGPEFAIGVIDATAAVGDVLAHATVQLHEDERNVEIAPWPAARTYVELQNESEERTIWARAVVDLRAGEVREIELRHP